MNDHIHRKGRMGYSICHKKIPAIQMSIYDEHVTCPKCLLILEEIAFTDTKTKYLQRLTPRRNYND